MNYLQLLQKGLRFVVKSALEEISKDDNENVNIFITFKTNFLGVSIPSFLLEKYPNNMTIVLQHEFWNLSVTDNHFSVDLMFGGSPVTLVIPFNAIYRFEDPDEPFSLDFIVESTDAQLVESDFQHATRTKSNAEDGNNIVSLSDFRKQKQDLDN